MVVFAWPCGQAEGIPEGTEVDDPLADFAGTPLPDLVECYIALSTIEAKFIADRLMEQSIPAIADEIDMNPVMGGHGPKVWVRQADLPRALAPAASPPSYLPGDTFARINQSPRSNGLDVSPGRPISDRPLP